MIDAARRAHHRSRLYRRLFERADAFLARLDAEQSGAAPLDVLAHEIRIIHRDDLARLLSMARTLKGSDDERQQPPTEGGGDAGESQARGRGE